MARATSRRSQAREVDDSVKIRRHRPDYKLVLFMGLLMMIGLVVMYAIGPQRANVLNTLTGSNISESYFFSRQAIYIFIALVAFVVAAMIPFNLIQKHAGKVLLIGLAACVLLAVADLLGWGIAQKSLGATRWFNFGFVSMQPSELLKFGVLVFVAIFLGRRMKAGEQDDLHKTLIPIAVVAALSIFFVIVLQKDMGTGVALVAILLTMLFVAQVKLRTIGLVVGLMIASMVVLVASAPHRMERVATFFTGDSVSVQDAGGYHIAHAKIAIGSGGLFGVGIGNSVQATGYLPEAINDSVFAIMGETFGFVGLVIVLLLFGALLMRIVRLIDLSSDPRMKILAAGVFGWLASHVLLNVAAMIGLVPLTGITLPLLSYGGTSMIFVAAALGLAFQVSGYTEHRSVNVKEAGYANSSSRRRVGRTRHASGGRTKRA